MNIIIFLVLKLGEKMSLGNLDLLPKDTLREILQYLEPGELFLRLGLTCKQGHIEVNKSEIITSIAKNLGLIVAPNEDPKQVIKHHVITLKARASRIDLLSQLGKLQPFKIIEGILKPSPTSKPKPMTTDQLLCLDQCSSEMIIREYAENLPKDIQQLINTRERLSAGQLKLLKKYSIERDTLLFWLEFAKAAQLAPPFQLDSTAFPTAEALIKKGAEFDIWCKSETILPLLKKIKNLSIHKRKLSYIPPQIENLENLEVLHLSFGFLSSLPQKIGKLKKLKDLNLSFNNFCKLPPQMGDLSTLSILNLNSNRLATIPSELYKLNSLITLQLAQNKLEALPKGISKLENLKELDLNNNRLTHLLPELKNMKKLKILRHYNNLF